MMVQSMYGLGIFSSVGVYPVTLKMKTVFNYIICLFNDIVEHANLIYSHGKRSVSLHLFYTKDLMYCVPLDTTNYK